MLPFHHLFLMQCPKIAIKTEWWKPNACMCFAFLCTEFKTLHLLINIFLYLVKSMEKYNCLCIFRPCEVATKQERLQKVAHSAKTPSVCMFLSSYLSLIQENKATSVFLKFSKFFTKSLNNCKLLQSF